LTDETNNEQPERVVPPSRSPFSDNAPQPAAPTVSVVARHDDDEVESGGRRPLGRRRAKLEYPARPGFHRRWLNDVPGRIDDAKAGGYAHVKDKEKGKPVMRIVGTKEGGGGLVAYLMEIPDALWNADFAKKQEDLDELDAQIFRGSYKQGADDKRYIPSIGIHAHVEKGPGRG